MLERKTKVIGIPIRIVIITPIMVTDVSIFYFLELDTMICFLDSVGTKNRLKVTLTLIIRDHGIKSPKIVEGEK